MATTSYSTDPALYLFTSLTAGSSHIITATSRLETILKANKIPFRAVDCATDEKARMLWGRRSKGRKLPGLVRYGEIIGDLEQIEEWNEYGELKDQVAASLNLGSLTTSSASIVPEPPTTTSTPQRSGPPSRASSETRHISIFDPKDKDKDGSSSGTEATSHKPTDAPINVALRQLGVEAAAKAGQKKAAAAQAAKAAVAPTKEPSTTDQIPVPAATKLSAEAAVESPETAPNVTAAKTPAQLATEGAKRTSVDKIADSEAEATSPVHNQESSSSLSSSPSSSTEAKILEQRRASSVTKTKSRLSESTPAEQSETVLSEEASPTAPIAVPEFEVSATMSPPSEGRARQHRGSDIGEASPEEIRALEKKLSIQEEDEGSDDEDAEGSAAVEDKKGDSVVTKEKKTEPNEKSLVSSTDEAEQTATKGTEPQNADAKDADQAGVSVGD
ncbi:hypothetical protein A1O1_08810 [Capronia coronata CBS 617.96]|uniref:Glutaredoxin domain-containing protein n=1 Tax=Capronia coronata CBS 617.96 TaxID=1182541 RepID=W9XM72_9EURO|nr:uncharacterized protein A1O1_08810 [Capronia coronata CBS 617.96]EXJ78410.1 hypothetical protein A1O1_08810 [Capronia coronata CBS 617.96]